MKTGLRKKIALCFLITSLASGMVAPIASAQTTDTAVLQDQTVVATNTDTGEQILDQGRQRSSGKFENSTWKHEYGVNWLGLKRHVWARTKYKSFDSKKKVDTYSRSRFEKGSVSYQDTGRKYDSKDGSYNGQTVATSASLSITNTATAHTYYGKD